MSRPHIEFINTADIPQRPWEISGLAPGGHTCILSRDEDSGAATELVTLPSNWQVPAGAFNTAVEIFTLDGRLIIGNYILRKNCYAYIPAGTTVGPWSAREATRLLWMPAAAAVFSATGQYQESEFNPHCIPCLDTSAMPWAGTITPGFPPGAMRKSLRTDPDTGAGTWLLGVLPQWRETRTEIHPCVEEAIVLSGSIESDRGLMIPGCYFWRPPFIAHGPMQTEEGVFIFFRTDGPLTTYYNWPDKP